MKQRIRLSIYQLYLSVFQAIYLSEIVKLVLYQILHLAKYLRELPEEEQCATNSSRSIRNCFGHKYAFHATEARQHQSKRHQQITLRSKAIKIEIPCLTKGYKHILAGALQTKDCHSCQEERQHMLYGGY